MTWSGYMNQSVRIEDEQMMMWQWHDAKVHFLHVLWTADGQRTIRLRCEVNPEENRNLLSALGIRTPVVDIEFRDIVEMQTVIHGVQATREVVVTWNVIRPSPRVVPLKHPGAVMDLTHHHIECSGGSVFDILGVELWLTEVHA